MGLENIMLDNIITFIVGFLGILLGHILTIERESKNRVKDIRIKYLIDAYNKLKRGVMPKAKKYDKGEFESAIAQIQLLGIRKQVELTYRFCEEAQSGKGDLIQELLENLRVELRNELSLKKESLLRIRPFRIQ